MGKSLPCEVPELEEPIDPGIPPEVKVSAGWPKHQGGHQAPGASSYQIQKPTVIKAKNFGGLPSATEAPALCAEREKHAGQKQQKQQENKYENQLCPEWTVTERRDFGAIDAGIGH